MTKKADQNKTIVLLANVSLVLLLQVIPFNSLIERDYAGNGKSIKHPTLFESLMFGLEI